MMDTSYPDPKILKNLIFAVKEEGRYLKFIEERSVLYLDRPKELLQFSGRINPRFIGFGSRFIGLGKQRNWPNSPLIGYGYNKVKIRWVFQYLSNENLIPKIIKEYIPKENNKILYTISVYI